MKKYLLIAMTVIITNTIAVLFTRKIMGKIMECQAEHEYDAETKAEYAKYRSSSKRVGEAEADLQDMLDTLSSEA